MLELGKQAIAYHKNISKILDRSKINFLITYGDLTKFTFEDVSNNSIIKKHFTTIDDLKKYIYKISERGDSIYLKGSRSMGLERIYK